jgi:hypothetical protein
MRVVEQSPYEVPPSSGTVWLDDKSQTWYSCRSKSVEINGRTYELPGGTLSLERSDSSREALLRALRIQRDLWRPNNEAGLIAYAEAMKK